MTLLWRARADHTFEVVASADGIAWSFPLLKGETVQEQPDGPWAAATDSIVVFIDNDGLGSPVRIVVGSS